MVSKRKPSNAKLTLFARTTKQTAQCRPVADRLQKRVRLFSIFQLVDEKIYFEVGELNIC